MGRYKWQWIMGYRCNKSGEYRIGYRHGLTWNDSKLGVEVRNYVYTIQKTFNIQIKYYLSPKFCETINNSQVFKV